MRFSVRRYGRFLAFRVTCSAAATAQVWTRDLQPLTDFLTLARNFNAERARAFACTWGPLGLCQHNRFPAHGRGAGVEFEADTLGPFEVATTNCPTRKILIDRNQWTAEPLDAWRDLASGAAALFDTAFALRYKRRPPARALKTLDLLRYGLGGAQRHYAALDPDPDVGAKRSPGEAWQHLVEQLNEWLIDAPVRFRCEVSAQGYIGVDFVVGDDRGVFPMLAAQLLARISDPAGGEAVTCSSCHLPFLQTRTPPTGRRRYCLICRESGAAIRDAARDYYRRKSEKGERHGQTKRG